MQLKQGTVFKKILIQLQIYRGIQSEVYLFIYFNFLCTETTIAFIQIIKDKFQVFLVFKVSHRWLKNCFRSENCRQYWLFFLKTTYFSTNCNFFILQPSTLLTITSSPINSMPYPHYQPIFLPLSKTIHSFT